jgi:hypothetical protein
MMDLTYYSRANMKAGRSKSISTNRAKKLLKKLEKQNGTKGVKEGKENVECSSEYTSPRKGDSERRKEENI